MFKVKDALQSKLETFLSSQTSVYQEIYLVGGAIRNTFLNEEVEDFDFVVKRNSILITKKLADYFKGKFYILDKQREIARALIVLDLKKTKIDFSLISGDSLAEDLSKRDFSINAMAIRIPVDGELIDPCYGKRDLENAILRPCSPSAFMDDPVRTIRAVRFIHQYQYHFDPDDREKLMAAVSALDGISEERMRDELINIFERANLDGALKDLMDLGVMARVFPEVFKLKDVQLSAPHTHDAWSHTKQVAVYCQHLMSNFNLAPSVDQIHPRLKKAGDVLDKFETTLKGYFRKPLTIERSVYAMLIFAALYHDSGKGVILPMEKKGRKGFPKHAKKGAELVLARTKTMGFSNTEANTLSKVVKNHMKPSGDGFIQPEEQKLHIHRFFRETGDAGVLVGILHLADVLATYEETISDDRWEKALTTVNNIMDAYFNHYEEVVSPPKIVNGKDIIKRFDLKPGKTIGLLIEQVVEAQVEGLIHTEEDALRYIGDRLAEIDSRDG